MGKGNGKVRRGGGIDQGGGSAARGGKKRKAGVAAEELQDEEVDRTSMRRKAARTRKVAEGEGERAERTDREQPSLEDDGDDIFQPSVTDRKGGKSGTRKGQQATLRSSKSPVMEAVKEVAATPAASLKGRKVRGFVFLFLLCVFFSSCVGLVFCSAIFFAFRSTLKYAKR